MKVWVNIAHFQWFRSQKKYKPGRNAWNAKFAMWHANWHAKTWLAYHLRFSETQMKYMIRKNWNFTRLNIFSLHNCFCISLVVFHSIYPYSDWPKTWKKIFRSKCNMIRDKLKNFMRSLMRICLFEGFGWSNRPGNFVSWPLWPQTGSKWRWCVMCDKENNIFVTL